MKVVILAGGKGTRISQYTHKIPKPMIRIGNTPMLTHIMRLFKFYGFNNFIIAGGYKIDVIKKYYLNSKEFKNLKIVFTGKNELTGGRILKLKKYLKNDESFFLTYGDGISNINIQNLIQFHQKNKRQATVTAVRPPARFGSLTIEDSLVSNFGEKISSHAGWINGGFFVLSKEILKYIDGDETIFEKKPLETLATTSNLAAYKHNGFWYPIDTIREKEIVEDKINNNELSWLYD